MNRPEARNALSTEMVDALSSTLHALETDDSVRAIVLRGEGDHFMAGGDVKSFAELGASGADPRSLILHRIHHLHTIMFAMRRMPKPILAAVRGAAAGAGVSLAAACDLVMASDDAFFVLAYVNIGASCDLSGSWSLPRLVGLRKALEIALLGERFDVAEALRLGLVNRVVPEAELEPQVLALAQRLAGGPAQSIAQMKRLMRISFEHDLRGQLDAERAAFLSCAATHDFAEGLDAFRARREPRFGDA